MKNKVVIIGSILTLVMFLAGCNELFSDSSVEIETIEISGDGVVQDIDKPGKPVKVIISGFDCIVSVSEETNLTEVVSPSMLRVDRFSQPLLTNFQATSLWNSLYLGLAKLPRNPTDCHLS